MPIMFVQCVQGARLDHVDAFGLQILKQSLTFDTIDRLQMVLVPEHLVQAWLEDGVSECYTHAVVCMQESATRPGPRSYLAFRTFEVLLCSYDHLSPLCQRGSQARSPR